MSMIPFSVYAHPGGRWATELASALKAANGLQSRFRYQLHPLNDVLSRRRDAVSTKKLDKKLRRADARGLVVCDEAFDEGLLVRELLPRIYITTDIERRGPSPSLYLIYQLAAATLAIHSEIGRKTNERMIHDPAVGCLWDWWETAKERTAAMVAARVCAQCHARLREDGVIKPEDLEAVVALLEYVRRCVISGPQDVADGILVAHGHKDDWKVLKTMLESFGLKHIEEFNAHPAAGSTVERRWREMLERARFAFAVMTPDDPSPSGGLARARQNVIHEIGLCHARLGIESTAVLLAEGTESFSNMDGINHIKFTSGRLLEKSEELRTLLEARGIL
jgi:hypothetical protein